MTEPTRTIKIYEKTHPTLRLLAAMTGETILELIDRMAREEKERLKEPVSSANVADAHERKLSNNAQGA